MHTQTIVRPALILIRGLPGSGKSYLAEKLAASLGRDKVVILDPDSINKSSQEYLAFSEALTADGVEPKFHPYRWSRVRGYDAIKAGKIIIWNQAFTDLGGFNRAVTSLQSFAAEHGIHLPVLVVEVDVTHNTAKRRVAERANQGGHNVSEEAFKRFINDYRSFSDEGFDVVSVNGEDDVEKSASTILAALQRL